MRVNVSRRNAYENLQVHSTLQYRAVSYNNNLNSPVLYLEGAGYIQHNTIRGARKDYE
jgi:hypothetical protein